MCRCQKHGISTTAETKSTSAISVFRSILEGEIASTRDAASSGSPPATPASVRMGRIVPFPTARQKRATIAVRVSTPAVILGVSTLIGTRRTSTSSILHNIRWRQEKDQKVAANL
jgi:hypothetical protein